MSLGIQVAGRNGAALAIAEALSHATLPAARLTIAADWENLRDLHGLDEESNGPFLLIENAGGGHAAVGPVFDSEGAGCFQCYIARRRANGGRECRPVDSLNGNILNGLVDEVKELVSGRSALRHAQIEIAPSGLRTRHCFLPVPSCKRCARRPRGKRVLQLEDLVSPRLGLVHEIRRIPGAPDGMVGIEAVGCRTDAFAPGRALNRGMALAYSESDARRRAIAESVERYCAALPGDSLPLARPDELAGAWLDPSRFPAVDIPLTSGSRLRWVKGAMLCSEEEVWAPASLVYVPYDAAPNETAADMQFSVGLAAGANLEDAIRHGLAEIVERDTSLRAWRMSQPVEALAAGPRQIEGLHLARIPNDSGLEVVTAFLEQPIAPLTSTGLGARPAIEEAAQHAVIEALQSRLWLVQWLGQNPAGFGWPSRTMNDNAAAHALWPALAGSRARWLHPPIAARTNGPPKDWNDILRRFPGACRVDITTPDVDAACLKVVRVLAPGRILADDDALRPRIGGCILPHPFG